MVKENHHNTTQLTDTFVSLFEKRVGESNASDALVQGEERRSYAELNQQANRIAHYLSTNGVQKGDVVGVLLPNSIAYVEALLGITKQGAVFLPIDPKHPAQRRNYLLQNSGAKVVLTDHRYDDFNAVNLEDIDWSSHSACNPDVNIDPEDSTYIIYTSGSTGQPKGVEVQHKALANMVEWQSRFYNITEKDNTTKYAGVAFDASVAEIFPALVKGATLHIIPEEIKLNMAELNRYYEQHKITVSFLPTQVCEQFYDEHNTSLRCLIAAGEKLNIFRKQAYKVYNNYGPTENAVVSTAFEVDKEYDNIPIGKPVSNTKALILDGEMRLQPFEAVGELYLGGASLAKGYVNNPELTAERFVKSPFGDELLYRTGDLAIMKPDGNIVFMGRVDQQVQIRGFRVEVGEIDHALVRHPDIEQGVTVDVKDDKGNVRLVAFYVSEKPLSEDDLAAYLNTFVPDYMIPTHFVHVSEIPLTVNGKADRKKLQEEAGSVEHSRQEYVAPRNETEKHLADIWQSVLGVEQVGIHDHFFKLGGHSIKAIQIASVIKKELGVMIDLKQIFRKPTIAEFAQTIQKEKQPVSSPAQEPTMDKAKIKYYYPLSPLQEGMLFHYLMDERTTTNVYQFSYRIDGTLNLELFEKSWNILTQRHDVLRTNIVHKKVKKPIQVVFKEREIPFATEDIRNLSDKKQEQYLEQFMEQDKAKGFDLSKDSLSRVAVVQLKDDAYEVLWTYHHIILDGWCMGILMAEMMHIYDTLLKGGEITLPEPKGFAEYIKYLSKIPKADTDTFWKNYLDGYEPDALLPRDKRGTEYAFEAFEASVSEDKVHQLQQLAEAQNVTLNTLLQTLWALVLTRFAGRNDVAFGYTVSGRPPEIDGVEQMVGLFINTIPVRIRVEDNDSFTSLLQKVHREAIDAQRFHHSSLADIKSLATNGQELFDHIVLFENFPIGEKVEEESEGVLGISDVHNNVRTNYDFNLIFLPGKTLKMRVEYNANVFSEDLLRQLATHFTQLVDTTLHAPESTLSTLSSNTEEQERIMKEINGTMNTYPKEKTIVQLFEEQVNATPQQMAVVAGDVQLTYGELNKKANKVAHYLLQKGVKPDDVLAIELHRSAEMIVSILGILKSGATYLPIDPSFPEDRKALMKSDANAVLTLTTTEMEETESHADENPTIPQTSDAIAYIMYTSGSTGTPKGIKIHHYAVNRLVKNTNYIDIQLEDNLLQLSNYAFDGSTFDIYGALLNGATLTLVQAEVAKDNQKLSTLIEEQKITIFFCTTALFNTLVDLNIDSLKGVRKILFGGERVSVPHVQKALKALGKNVLVHVYGPTESTTFATYHNINEAPEGSTNIPIGRPISNTQVYVLDKYGRLCGVNMPGELCIAGDGLAAGYLNNPELTAEKFIIYDGKRIYKTGDLVRLNSKAEIEFLDRIDSQVKIRGFRIELGEIEHKLLQHDGIKESFVTVATDEQNHKFLAAYYVAEGEISSEAIEATLSQSLPDYMLPNVYIHMDAFPLNSSGKVNKRELPTPRIGAGLQTEYVAPRNETEEKLAAVWQQVLSVERVGIHDNFFKLGGHSLKAIQMVSAIKKQLEVDVELKTIFSHPTIAEFANALNDQKQGILQATEEVVIEKAPVKEHYALSSAQKRQFFLYQLDPESLVYNMPIVMEVEGELDVARLENVINTIVARHESLRTRFVWVDNEVMQYMEDEVTISVTVTESETDQIKEAVNNLIQPFQLETGPVLRAGLIKLEARNHILVIDMHHIISDGVSMNVLTQEFMELMQGGQPEPLLLQYKDYSEWQNSALQQERLSVQKDFWLRTLDGELPVLQLPEDFPRPANQSFDGAEVTFELDATQTQQLRALSEKEGATLFVTLFSVYALLLSKYSGQHDVIVGTPISGRPHQELQRIIGMFVNTLALRVQHKGEESFTDYLNKVKDICFDAFQHQEFQFEELIEHLNLPRDPSRNPVFDTLFTLHNADNLTEVEIDGLHFKAYGQEHKIAKFDLSFTAQEYEDGIAISVTYGTKLFRRETIRKMADAFQRVIDQVLSAPQTKLADITLLSGDEKTAILDRSNALSGYPESENLAALFEEMASTHAERPALTFGDSVLTYRELNEKANQLAHHILAQRSIQKDDLIGVLANRSEHLIIAVMAVLKTGAAYVPIDPDYPQDRIDHMISDSGIAVLLKDAAVNADITFSGDIIDVQDAAITQQSVENPSVKIPADSLAYIIYTSGSTGLPKGTMVEHRNVISLMKPEKALFDFNEQDVWTLFHSFCFDFSVWEIFGALLFGGRLVMVPKETAGNPQAFAQLVTDEKVTVLNQIPSLFLNNANQLLSTNADVALRYVIFGGEALKPASLKSWMQRYPQVKMINMYGITETTVHVTYKHITMDEVEKGLSNIGKPITTLNCMILDENQRLVPDGVPGEICVGGHGVTRGYLHKPELTAQRFIENPYLPEDRLYRSGDLGRFLPDGDIEYLGRIDHQVKIRGHRIEIGEVENVIQSMDEVEDAVVMAKNDPSGEKVLVAYVKSTSLDDVSVLRDHLKTKLPQYSLPSYFSLMKAFPVSPTGKIDRRALPDISELISTSAGEMKAPSGELEQKVAEAWKAILKIDQVSVEANFFEVGGHSLKATQLSNYFLTQLQRKVSIKDIFTHPTIAEQARLIAGLDSAGAELIPKVEQQEYYPLSYAQERVWVACQFEGATEAFNMPVAFKVKGELDADRFEKALKTIIERHESLRTSFVVVDGSPVQQIHDTTDFSLTRKDVSGSENPADEAERIANVDAAHPFDLTDQCLMRATLVTTGAAEYVFALNMHHIVSDGWSMQVFTDEVFTLYAGDTSLPELSIQYKDFAAWQRDKIEKDTDLANYWKSQLTGVKPLTVSQRERPNQKTFGGAYHNFGIEGQVYSQLKGKGASWKVSTFHVMQAVYQVLLYRLSSQTNFAIGTPDAGRNHPELERQIGFYVNMVPLRASVDTDHNFRELLAKVSETTTESLEHSIYPFDKMVEDLGLKTSGSRMPVFDYGITWQNMADLSSGSQEYEDVMIEAFEQEYPFAKYDLWLFGYEREDGISLKFEYNTDILTAAEVEQFAAYFTKIVEEVCENDLTLISDIQLTDEVDAGSSDEDTSFSFDF